MSDQSQGRPFIRAEMILFLGVFLGCIWVHQPRRYYFFGDSWDILYAFLINWKSIAWPQNDQFIPLFKALYFLEYKLFGSHHLPYMLVLFAIHAGSAVMVYRLGVRLSFRRWPSAVAALIFAFSSIQWEVTTWSIEQLFALAALLILIGTDVFLAKSRGRKTLLGVAVLIFAACLAGGPIAASLPLVLTAYCLLRIFCRGEGKGRELVENMLAFWLPLIAYMGLAKAFAAPGGLSVIPHFSLHNAPALLDYMFFGTVYGVVLGSLTFLQAQTLSSATVLIVLLVALVGFCYRNLSSDQQFSFWFLVAFLFTPMFVIGLGRLPLGSISALSSRYSYVPIAPFALLLVLCWEGLRSKQVQRGNQVWWNGLAILLFGYYFMFHFAMLRRHNLGAIRGEASQQFLAVARRATYPQTVQSGTVVLGPELPVPEYVFAPGRLPLWKAFQVLDGNTSTIVPVAQYLADANVSIRANFIEDGDFERSDSVDTWKTYGDATFERSQTAARTGKSGIDVTLGPAGAFSKDVIDTCPADIAQTIFTLSIQAKSNGRASLVARIASKDLHGTILGTVTSDPHPGDGQWHPLVVSALTPPGTCVVGVDVTNAGPTEIESALDDVILVAHPGTVTSNGQMSFRDKEAIESGVSSK